MALETEKWIHVLQRMGHEVSILSGHFKENILPPENQKMLPCLSFFSPECEWEQNRAFFFPPVGHPHGHVCFYRSWRDCRLDDRATAVTVPGRSHTCGHLRCPSDVTPVETCLGQPCAVRRVRTRLVSFSRPLTDLCLIQTA